MHVRLDGPESVETAWGYFVLAEALRLRNKFAEALTSNRRALDLMRKTLPRGHRSIAIALTGVVSTLESAEATHSLADLFSSAAEMGELASIFREVVDTSRPSTFDSDDAAFMAAIGLARFSVFYVDLSQELAAAGKSREAEESRKSAIVLIEKLQTQMAGTAAYLPYVYGYGTIAMAQAREPRRSDELGRELLKMTPKTGNWNNQVAWSLVSAEDPALRNPGLAIKLATKAVEADPASGPHRNTLGIARYRAGDWTQAIADLEKSVSLSNGGDSNDWFFLAMAHWRLGDNDLARKWYNQAIVWMDKNQSKHEELRRFRAEAAELLEVKGDKN